MPDDVQRITGTDAKVAARLCNFETAKAYLLLAHIDFLDKEVAAVIRGMNGPWVDLYGYASRAGDATFNMALSDQRLNAVKERISQYANKVNFVIHKAFGETQSGPNERDNSGYWRAVEVYVYAHQPPAPKPVEGNFVSRFIVRRFSKMVTEFNNPNPKPDDVKPLYSLLTNKVIAGVSPEAALGDEAGSEAAPFPEDYRVNRTVIDTKLSYSVTGPGSITITTTTFLYQWGPPFPNVAVEERYTPEIFGKQRPTQTERKTMTRAKAESTPLIIPPDPSQVRGLAPR